jgi:hypothetical protein
MVFCAVNMLLAQTMGLHFHQHIQGGGAGHGTSLHLRDAGMHLHEAADKHDSSTDRASHPDEDLEIDPLGAGFAKFSKVWLNTAFVLLATICLVLLMPAVLASFEPQRRRHPALFFLRPPSHAPPLQPLTV